MQQLNLENSCTHLVGVTLDFVDEAENWVQPGTSGENLEFPAAIKFEPQWQRPGWTENGASRAVPQQWVLSRGTRGGN